jgi:hypothetical protein
MGFPPFSFSIQTGLYNIAVRRALGQLLFGGTSRDIDLGGQSRSRLIAGNNEIFPAKAQGSRKAVHGNVRKLEKQTGLSIS